VIRGAGQAFAAGTDISQFQEFRTGDDGIVYERRLDAVIDRLECVRCPTIAAVNGAAVGGGFAIACTCDLRICTTRARFGIPIAKTLGNCLSLNTCDRLTSLLGLALLKDLLFTARLLDAQEARSLGLVTRVVDESDFDAAVGELATTVASYAPITLSTTKAMLRRQRAHARAPHDAADDLLASCYGSGDFHEGVAAFVARRAPRWTGQ
jgi:enoyl-CoA hydratase/carnithine racemase